LAATNQYFAPHLIRLRGFFCLTFAAVATPTIDRSPGVVGFLQRHIEIWLYITTKFQR
jgi:hypothetical protein